MIILLNNQCVKPVCHFNHTIVTLSLWALSLPPYRKLDSVLNYESTAPSNDRTRQHRKSSQSEAYTLSPFEVAESLLLNCKFSVLLKALVLTYVKVLIPFIWDFYVSIRFISKVAESNPVLVL